MFLAVFRQTVALAKSGFFKLITIYHTKGIFPQNFSSWGLVVFDIANDTQTNRQIDVRYTDILLLYDNHESDIMILRMYFPNNYLAQLIREVQSYSHHHIYQIQSLFTR